MDNQLDQKIVNLARAIKHAETGNSSDPYNAVGDNGTSFGAYQFQPSTWSSWAKEFLGDSNAPKSVENQNRVAYNRIKSWKDQGYNPAQIASMWNSGRPNAYKDGTGIGHNASLGVDYNVPQYVQKVSDFYNQYKQPSVISAQPQQYQDTPSIEQSPQIEQPLPEKKPGYFSRVGSDISQNIGSAIEDISGNPEDNRSAFSKGVSSVSNVASAVASPITELPILKQIGEFFGKAIDWTGEKVSDLYSEDFKKKLSEMPEEEFRKFSQPLTDLANVGNVANTLLIAKGAKDAKPKIQEAVDATKNAASNAAKPIVNSVQDKVVSSVAKDWEKIGNDYSKTSKLISQDIARAGLETTPESFMKTPEFLASRLKVLPQDIIDNGKFDKAKISEIASHIEKEVAPIESTMNDVLRVAQEGQTKIPINEIRESIVSKIDKSEKLTPKDMADMIDDVDAHIRAIENKYPGGVTLEEANKLKGNYWRKTKFDITKPLQPQVNYNIGSALKEIIEKRTGSDARIAELNAELGNYYKSKIFLNGLEGKAPKLTVRQKVVRGAVKGAAVLTGEHLFGIKGGIAGYILSRSVIHMLENSSNPVKALILKNLKVENPKAYIEAIKWLGEKEAEKLERLALPESSTNL